jgi:hypothetical protein
VVVVERFQQVSGAQLEPNVSGMVQLPRAMDHRVGDVDPSVWRGVASQGLGDPADPTTEVQRPSLSSWRASVGGERGVDSTQDVIDLRAPALQELIDVQPTAFFASSERTAHNGSRSPSRFHVLRSTSKSVDIGPRAVGHLSDVTVTLATTVTRSARAGAGAAEQFGGLLLWIRMTLTGFAARS